MWAQAKKFAPFAVILGYFLVYMNKGWDKILTDLKGITVEKLQAKWQNLLVAVAAGVALYIITRVKMPAAFKALLMVFLYLLIGYNVASAIDPPNGSGNYNGGARFVTPRSRNPYLHGGS